VQQAAFSSVFAHIWDWGIAISLLLQLPYIIGGLLLIMIGRQKYPCRRAEVNS